MRSLDWFEKTIVGWIVSFFVAIVLTALVPFTIVVWMVGTVCLMAYVTVRNAREHP